MDGTHFAMGKLDETFLIAAEACHSTPESHLGKWNDDSLPVEQFNDERKERPPFDERTQCLVKFFCCHGLLFASENGLPKPLVNLSPALLAIATNQAG
jgi:hypothetical protein